MDLKAEAKHIGVTIRIGKSGLSEAQIAEVKKQLRTRKVIKIKMLRSFVLSLDERKELDEIPHVIANLTNSRVVFNVGNTFALTKQTDKKR